MSQTDDPALADLPDPDHHDDPPPKIPPELIEFTLQNCQRLAFKLKALHAFGATEYQYRVQKLVDDGVIAENEFARYKSLLSRWLQVFDAGPKRKASREPAASASTSAPSKPKRSKAPPRWNDPRMKKVYRSLACHVQATAPALPEQVLQNLDLLIPDAIYHALYAKMKMTPQRVEAINRDLFGDPNPARDLSAEFNIFRYSCAPGHPIAHGTLTVAYSATTRAHKTIESYDINGIPYELTGCLVQPDLTYRIFSTHAGSGTTVAQVMLVAPWGTSYLGRKKGHEHLKGQLRQMRGVVLDVHNRQTIYTTRVLIRRPDQDHPRLSPGILPSDRSHDLYREDASKLKLLDHVRAALEHHNAFQHSDVIGFL